jgi:hypothetical protein
MKRIGGKVRQGARTLAKRYLNGTASKAELSHIDALWEARAVGVAESVPETGAHGVPCELDETHHHDIHEDDGFFS